jgi:hypothetical protein
MKPLAQLAEELSAMDAPDLRRIRDMTEADFAMLMALHAAEESALQQVSYEMSDDELAGFLRALGRKGGAI